MRLAVIGLASSHVDQLIRLARTGQLGPARITALIAPDCEPVTGDRLAALGVTPARSHGTYDAALVTTRDPATHRALAEPLLEAGVPVFVDKPFVAEAAEAEYLVALAQRSRTVLSSSSALRWHPVVQAAGRSWAARGQPVTMRVSGPADPASPHGGRSFLGVHAVEAALGALGALTGAAGIRTPVTVVAVSDRGDRRVAQLAAGPHRATIELGPYDGWHLRGPGVDTTVELDDEYLRPGVLGFIESALGRSPQWPVSGRALVEAARVLSMVCR